jgi:hypothetical protein
MTAIALTPMVAPMVTDLPKVTAKVTRMITLSAVSQRETASGQAA